MIKLILFLLSSFSLYAAPAQILIIRHAEKETSGKKELTTRGLERAAALPYYLTRTEELLQFGPPVEIFAAKKGAKYDNAIRILQTATPLSEYLKIPIQKDFTEQEPEKLANYVLSKKEYEGKNLLIVWHQEGIPCLIEALGFKAPACSGRFDLVYLLAYPADPQTEVKRYTQKLLFGDDPELPAYGSYSHKCPSVRCD